MSIRSISSLAYLTISLSVVVVLGGCTAVTPSAGSTQSQLQSGVEEDKAPSGDMTDRQAEVAERGAQVMPFDLEQTTHIFEKLDNGGVQRIITNNGADADQVHLIQMHLGQEAKKFQAGDFGDPAQVHGMEMPGLSLLRTRANAVKVHFTALENGAQLDYISDDPELIAAIHAWFDAQLSDHDTHATDTTLSASSAQSTQNTSATVNLPVIGAIWTANEQGNSVTVIGAPVGAFPHGLRASPDGRWVAVANLRDDSVSLIDAATLSVTATMAVGAGPVQVAFASDGATLYVTLNGENAVAAVDLATQRIKGKATVSAGPVQVYLTPDGSLALVANQGTTDAPGTTLSFVDTTSLAEVKAIARR
ncbi:MAG: YncE family protein, partial [Caldilinea sp.]